MRRANDANRNQRAKRCAAMRCAKPRCASGGGMVLSSGGSSFFRSQDGERKKSCSSNFPWMENCARPPSSEPSHTRGPQTREALRQATIRKISSRSPTTPTPQQPNLLSQRINSVGKPIQPLPNPRQIIPRSNVLRSHNPRHGIPRHGSRIEIRTQNGAQRSGEGFAPTRFVERRTKRALGFGDHRTPSGERIASARRIVVVNSR